MSWAQTARRIPLALLFVAVAAAPAAGQPISAKGQVTVGVHEVEMKAGTLYAIKIEGKGFQPRVAMSPGRLLVDFSFGGKPNVFQAHYIANKNETNTFHIVPELFDLRGKGPFEYAFEATPLPLAAKAVLDVKGELVAADPGFKADFADRKHHKAYDVKLEGGTMYVMDLKAPDGSKLDCYLYLLDAKGKVLRSDDDSGGFPNARILFQAPATGDYRLIATGLGDALGAFTLTVRGVAKK